MPAMNDTVFAPLEGPRPRPWTDTRASHAEQQDHMPPVGAASNGDVLLLLAPIVLTLIGAGSLLISFIR
jgi:hypothetical protein